MPRNRITWKYALLAAVVLGVLALGYALSVRRALADCPTGCDYCSADPVFVQPDLRRPEMIEFIRKAKAKGAAVIEKKGLVLSVK